MKNKVYLLACDPQPASASLLHQVITSSPYVSEWWHYLLSAYLLISDQQGYILQKDIKTRWGDKEAFLLIEVNTSNASGILPQEAWDWINSKK